MSLTKILVHADVFCRGQTQASSLVVQGQPKPSAGVGGARGQYCILDKRISVTLWAKFVAAANLAFRPKLSKLIP